MRQGRPRHPDCQAASVNNSPRPWEDLSCNTFGVVSCQLSVVSCRLSVAGKAAKQAPIWPCWSRLSVLSCRLSARRPSHGDLAMLLKNCRLPVAACPGFSLPNTTRLSVVSCHQPAIKNAAHLMCTVGVQARSDAVHSCARTEMMCIDVHWCALVCRKMECSHYVHHTISEGMKDEG
jgi:hypothetical protein